MEVKVKSDPLLNRLHLPHIGLRIIKTAVAVFLILLISYLFSHTGWTWSIGDACVAAIICMQPYKVDALRESLNRLLGISLGAFWGLVLLLILWNVPHIGDIVILRIILISIGIILSLHSCVMLKIVDAAALCAIIYISIICTYPAVHTPFLTSWHMLSGTALGILIAYIVNDFHLPGEKHPEYIFFIKLQDLVPDRYAHVASYVHVSLNRLFDEGAKICLTTRWAPAFLISQMGSMKVNVPAIVMDGAAVYDIGSNKYLDIIDIPHEDAVFVADQLTEMGLGYSVLAISDQSLLIYRQGPMNWAEEQEYKVMKRSPYRNYVDGNFVKEDKVAVIRFLARESEMDDLLDQVKSRIGYRVRYARRKLPGVPGYEGLYITHPDATIENRKKEIVEYAVQTYRMGITPVDVISPFQEFRSERDALYLLNRVRKKFEPSFIRAKFMK